MSVVLYHGGPASNGLKAMLALCEKGVEFEPRYINMRAFEQHDPEYLKINPAGQIPALIHDGRVLTESTVIAEYVDAAFDGPALRPADEWDRAQMRIWTKYVDEFLRPAMSNLAWTRMAPAIREQVGDEEFERRLDAIPLGDKREKWELSAKGLYAPHEIESWKRTVLEAADRIEAQLEGQDWLVRGAEPTLADYAVFSMGFMLPLGHAHAANAERTPRLMDWLERLKARPGVQQALAVPMPGKG